MRHGSKARTRTAEEVRLEFPEFWVKESPLRAAWLEDYTKPSSTHELASWPLKTPEAVHVASALGYTQLVANLISNGHQSEIGVHDAWHNTPVRKKNHIMTLSAHSRFKHCD